MDIQRKAFEESNNVNPDWSFKFDEELQQYIAVDFEMTSQVDEFNEHWDTFRAGWDAKAQAVPEQVLKNHCMVGQTWFMEGTPVSALIKHAESVYKAEVIAQNSKIEFGTDDNENWFAHDVPFYGTVQIYRIEEHGLVEWDIHFNGCWQGPFGSKSECIKHLEGCIAEEHEEAQEQVG